MNRGRHRVRRVLPRPKAVMRRWVVRDKDAAGPLFESVAFDPADVHEFAVLEAFLSQNVHHFELGWTITQEEVTT